MRKVCGVCKLCMTACVHKQINLVNQEESLSLSLCLSRSLARSLSFCLCLSHFFSSLSLSLVLPLLLRLCLSINSYANQTYCWGLNGLTDSVLVLAFFVSPQAIAGRDSDHRAGSEWRQPRSEVSVPASCVVWLSCKLRSGLVVLCD